MAASVVVDASFLVALLDRQDQHHAWAVSEASRHIPIWHTCESALSEAFFLVGDLGGRQLASFLSRGVVVASFGLSQELHSVLVLMQKYADVPMSLADGCLVRMTEILPDPLVLTTDSDFRLYRRNGRQMIPCVLPR